MAFLNDIEQLRKITWGVKYLWDIQFENAPAPFDEWFPAVDVDEDVAHLDSFTFESAQDTHRIPQSSTSLSFKVTFHDDEKGTLLKWFKNWINVAILNDGKYVSTLDTSVRLIRLLKLNHAKEVISGGALSYYVYPEGTITDSRDSSSDPLIYSVNFVIVGKGP